MFYTIGNEFPLSPESSITHHNYHLKNATLLNTTFLKHNPAQSTKLTSLYLYTARLLGPIFDNNLVFITTLHSDAQVYPNMGSEERKTCKLKRFLEFLKLSSKELKMYGKDRDSETRAESMGFAYENATSNEIDQIDALMSFVFRCILGLELVEQIGSDFEDFQKAFRALPFEWREVMKEIQFKDLTKDVMTDTTLKLFIKKLLEIKAQKFRDFKEVKRMWEEWRKKWGVFVDSEFIGTFIAEYQLQRMIEIDSVKDEVFYSSLKELSRYPVSFEVEKVVYLLIRMNKIPELISLLSLRFLYIEKQEEENKKANSAAYSHVQETEFFNKQKEECVSPILQILERVYVSLMKSENKDINVSKLFRSLLNFKSDKSIYDFLTEERLMKLKVLELNTMKSKLIESILLHDSERLHRIVLDWMTDKELYEDLKYVNSKYYGVYVEKFEKQSSLNIYQIELVTKFLQGKLFKSNSLEQITSKEAKDIEDRHIRLIKFLSPIITCDIRQVSCKVKGEFKINQRLVYTGIVIQSIEDLEPKFSGAKELAAQKKSMQGYQERLIIQSEIENQIVRMMQKCTDKAEEEKKLKPYLIDINSWIFDPIDLIENFTDPLKLFDFTIKILKYIVTHANQSSVNQYTREKVVYCYKEIITFYVIVVNKSYPSSWVQKMHELAKLYYLCDTSCPEVVPRKRCKDEIKTAFFPAESILEYVIDCNERFYKDKIYEIKFIDDALDHKKIETTPYWFIGLLFDINRDCMSHVILIFHKSYKKTSQIQAFVNLIIGIKKYMDIIKALEHERTNFFDHEIIAEYKQFLLNLNQIIDDIKVS